MNAEQVRALFLLAGIEVEKLHQLENKYWPDVPVYAELRRTSPWWLVRTPFGEIEIGWRKRVMSIDWSDTKLRELITEDDVTKDEHLVHAWTYVKALEYLSNLRKLLAQRAVAVAR